MWEIGNVWNHEAGKSNATPMAASSSPSYLAVMHEIHVLLVDHDSDCLVATAKLLELYQYRVTVAELASGAIQVLSIGKAKNRPNYGECELTRPSTNQTYATGDLLRYPVMSGDENPFTALRAIETGAYLYVQKPATKETIKSLWQHIVRDKLVRSMRSERERLMATNYNMRGIEFRNNNVGGHMLNLNNNMLPMDNGTLKNGNYTMGRKGVGEDDYESENHMLGSKIKRKVCTEWTQELHEKFMDAVQQLGEGRCFPKEILELMNVPGLTRMQVASHLQKCRNDNWRSPEERKSSSSTQHAPSSDPENAAPHKPRRFGSMPKLGSKAAATASKEASGGGTPGEGSKGPQSETESPNGGGVESMESDEPSAVVTNNNSSNGNSNNNNNPPPFHHHQVFRAMVPAPSSVNMGPPAAAAVVAIPRIGSEVDFFNFTDMDCLVQNYSGLGQASAVVGLSNIASSSSGGYHFDPLYHHELQNSTMPSVDNRSQWSSETTSNFGSDRDSRRGAIEMKFTVVDGCLSLCDEDE